MKGLLIVDLLAAIGVFIGFQLGFRQNAFRRWFGRRVASQSSPSNTSESYDEMASVRLMIGIMIMAFSFTAGVFANLIAYYTAASPH